MLNDIRLVELALYCFLFVLAHFLSRFTSTVRSPVSNSSTSCSPLRPKPKSKSNEDLAQHAVEFIQPLI